MGAIPNSIQRSSRFIGRVAAVAALLGAGWAHAQVSSPLIIHPTLNYTASLGRSVNDKVNAIAVGADGSTYVAGISPAKSTADHDEAFIAHVSADGKTLLYMTYLGGSGATDARAIALDLAGNAYVTGETKAPDFPVLNSLQSTCTVNQSKQCAGDAFVAKMNADGSLNFATYLGGAEEDAGNAITLDSAGDIYVAGSTASIDFPAFRGVQPSNNGNGDAFVAKLSADGLHILYATYLGGTGADEALGIAVDAKLSAYITGRTQSPDFPVKDALQPQCRVGASNQCQGEAFVTKLSPDGTDVVYSTYLGGSGGDSANAIALNLEGNAFIAGTTSSEDFPLVKPLQAKRKGKSEAFVAKLLPDGSGLVYATYLGGSGDDAATSIAVDTAGKVFIGGQTNSADFPTQGPLQAACRKDAAGVCSTDAFLAVLNPAGTGLQFSTYLGGSGTDEGRAIAVDAKGAAYLGGGTTTLDFPMVAVTVMEPGAAPASPGPFGSLRAQSNTAAKASGLPVGGIVAKISGIEAQTSCSGVTWTGTAGDKQWTTPGNWSGGAVPVASDTVCIGSGFAGTTITIGSISAAANQTISSLASYADISFIGGPLTVTGGATFVNKLLLTGGILTLNGTNGSSVGGAMMLSNALLAGTDTLNITGLLTWNNEGYMCAIDTCGAPTALQGVTNANGGIAGSGVLAVDGRTLNNAGSAAFTSGSGYYLYLAYGAVVNNLPGATWNLAGDSGITYSTGGGTFNNKGTFAKTGGSSVSNVNASFVNTGSVQANAYTLNLTNVGSEAGGKWSAVNGAVLNLSAANGATPTLTGGTYSGGATGLLQFGAVGNGVINLAGAPTFTTIPVAIPGAALDVNAGTTVTLPSLNLAGVLSGPGTLNVTGLLTWTYGGFMCAIDSCGAPAATQGVTNANGGITGSGYLYLYGRTLNNAGTAAFTSLNGYYLYLAYAGVVNNLPGATWNLAGDNNITYSTGGGTFNNKGTFAKTGGTGTSTVDVFFVNTGAVRANVNGTTLSLNNVGSETGGSWSAANGAVLNLSAANATTATLTGGKYSGAGYLQFGTTGNGIIDLSGAPTFTVSVGIPRAVLDVTAGTTVTVPTLNLAGVLSGPGTLNVTGLLTWTYGGFMCAIDSCGAPAATQGVTNANGGITGSGYLYLYGRTLNNAGTAAFTSLNGYYLYLAYAGVVNNLPGATWNLAGDNNITYSTGGGTFNNKGTFAKTGGTGTSTVDVFFVNTGAVQANVNGTTLSLNNVGSETGGSWSAANGAVLNLSAANATTATLTGGKYSGAGYLQFGTTGNGIIDLSGAPTFTVSVGIPRAVLDVTAGTTVTVPTLNLAGVLSGPGTLNVTGLLTWTYGGFMCAIDSCGAPAATQGVTNANGGITGSGYMYLYGRTLNNAGTAAFTSLNGYYLYLAYAGVVNNLPGATWNLAGDNNITYSTGGGTFNNKGTFAKTGGTGTSTVDVFFVNTGAVRANVNGTTLSLNNVGSETGGSWSAANGAVLNLSAANATTATLTGGKYSGAGYLQFGTTGNGIIDLSGAPTFTVSVGIPRAVLDVTAGTTVTVPTLNLAGVLSGPGTLNVTGLLTWTYGGFMCAIDSCGAPAATQGVTNANGGITGSGYLYLYGRTLNNAGTAAFTSLNGYYLYLAYAGVVNNLPGATWNLAGDNNITYSTGGGTFNNKGTFAKTGGTGTSTVDVFFVNTGAVQANVNGTTLSLNNVGSETGGSWSAANGAVLNLSAANATTATLTGGKYSGAGYLQFGTTGNGIIDLSGAPTFTVSVGIPRAVLDVTAGTTVTVPTLNLAGVLSGPGTLNVTGLLTWTYGGFMCAIDSCGAPAATQGVTNANGGITGSGYMYLYGRTLNNAGTAAFTSLNGYYLYLAYAGVVNNLPGATWNLAGDNNITYSTGGGTFNNKGTFAKTGGTGTSTVDVFFVNTGAVQANVNGTTLSLNNVGSETGGSWSAANGAVLNLSAANATTATLTGGKYSGAGYLQFGTTGNGIIDLSGAPTFTVSVGIPRAVLDVTAGTTVTVPTLNLAGVLSGPGTLNVTGLLTWTYGGFMCAIDSCGAPAATQGVTNANGGITGSGYLYLYGRTLNNAGTAAFTSLNGYYLYLAYAGVVNNLPGATWNLAGDNNITYSTGGGTFNNKGTFAKTGGTGTSTVDVTLNNSGTVAADVAQLYLYGTYTQTAGTTLLGGGSLQFGSTPNIQGGSITGSGTISGNYTTVATNPAGAIAPGTTTAAGAISLTGGSGNYTAGTGSLNVKIGGLGAGQFDTLTASGTAALAGGTLNVTTFGAYNPKSTDSFTILTANSVTGKFATVNLPSKEWIVKYTATSVVLNAAPGTKTLVSIAVTPASPSIANGLTQQFTATGTYSDGSTGDITANVTWASATTSVATIASGGLATGVGVGTSNITANKGTITSPAVVLTVTPPKLVSIAVTPSSATITAGATQQFTATGTYSDGSTGNITATVTWASANTSVATIASGGLATGVAKGSSNITASLSGITSPAALLMVTKVLQSIAVTPANPTIAAGATQQFTATGTYSDGSTGNITATVTWASPAPRSSSPPPAPIATAAPATSRPPSPGPRQHLGRHHRFRRPGDRRSERQQQHHRQPQRHHLSSGVVDGDEGFAIHRRHPGQPHHRRRHHAAVHRHRHL